MTYTIWHAGILIGTSELDHPSMNPGQRAGIFQPTPYGLAVFPRLTGILTVGYQLKRQLEAKGFHPETMDGDEIAEAADDSPVTEKLLDLGRMLSEVEVRGPDGNPMEFASIAFSDVQELYRLTREMELGSGDELADLPPEAPRYIVSATFRSGKSRSKGKAHPRTPWKRHWSNNN